MPKSLIINLTTLAIGACGALLFIAFGLSLPWVLGSMLACACVALFGRPLRISPRWRTSGLAIIGITLGSSFTTDTLTQLTDWLTTLLIMLLVTAFYAVMSYKILHRWSGTNRLTSFFSAMPGGLSMVTALSEHYEGNTRRIALSHSARLIILLVLTPIILKYVGNHELPTSNTLPPLTLTAPTYSLPSLFFDYISLIFCGFIGVYLANKVNFPTGVLLFPLILSATCHSAGLIGAPIPASAIALSQVIIGSSVGVRFVGYKWKNLIQDGWLAIIIGLLLALLSTLTALLVSYVSGLEFASLLLILLPGGAPELGVMALALNINPAMVATHHMIRVAAIAIAISLLLHRFTTPPQRPH